MKKVALIFLALLLFPAGCMEAIQQTESGVKDGLSEQEKIEFEIGDIVLADGTMKKWGEYTAIDEDNPPVAVIAGQIENTGFFSLGVQRSGTTLLWEDADGNRPAADFASNYGDYCGAGEEWALPNLDELKVLYENRETISQTLQAIYRLDSSAAMDGLGTNWYWACDRSETEEDYVGFIHFFNGYRDFCPKNFTNVHAIVVRMVEGGGGQ